MKVAVIGGGSTYTQELVNGFLDRVNEYPLNELWLMDIDEHRLSIVGGFYPANGAGHGVTFQGGLGHGPASVSRWLTLCDHSTSRGADASAPR